MTCLKCGANNIEGSSFCIKCGANLKEIQGTSFVNATSMQNDQQINIQPEQPIFNQPQSINQFQTYNQVQSNNQYYANNQQVVEQPINNSNISSAPLNYLMYIIAVLLKPFKSFKDEEAKLNNTKTAFILTMIMSCAATIINLLKLIFEKVRVYNYDYTIKSEYVWRWDNLKKIDWFQAIGKNFLIYLCVILSIAIVFYIGSLIVKKELQFIKSLSIAATSIIPALISTLILSPLLGKIWNPLSIVFMVLGCSYSLIILYELVNDDLKLEGDVKIYFNLVCFGLLVVAAYYVFMNLFMSSTLGGLSDLLDLFG